MSAVTLMKSHFLSGQPESWANVRTPNCLSCDPSATKSFNASVLRMQSQVNAGTKGTAGFVTALLPDVAETLKPFSTPELTQAVAIANQGGSVKEMTASMQRSLKAEQALWSAKLNNVEGFARDPLGHINGKVDQLALAAERAPAVLANLRHADAATIGFTLGTIASIVVPSRGGPMKLFANHDGPPPATAFTATRSYFGEDTHGVLVRLPYDVFVHNPLPSDLRFLGKNFQQLENPTLYARHNTARPDQFEFQFGRMPTSEGIVVNNRDLNPTFSTRDGGVERPMVQAQGPAVWDPTVDYMHRKYPEALVLSRAGHHGDIDPLSADLLRSTFEWNYGFAVPLATNKREFPGIEFSWVPAQKIEFLDRSNRLVKSNGPVDKSFVTELNHRGFDVTRAPEGIFRPDGSAVAISSDYIPLVNTARALGMDEIPIRRALRPGE